ncbi:MAG: alanine racemase [Myxococcota bacterium]
MSQLVDNSWVETDSAALASNVALFKQRLAPGSRLGVVVKSNAYGHGAALASRAFVDAGADWLIVNDVVEALALRDAGLEAPIYICGPVPPAAAPQVVAARARTVVYDGAFVTALDAAGRAAGWVVPLHIKIETGNTRQGIDAHEALALAERIASLPGVRLEGLATHYADIEDTTDHTFAQSQLRTFLEVRDAFIAAGYPVEMSHSANSAAAILWPKTHGEMVRVGIAAYGLWPSRETYVTALQAHARREDGLLPELAPALSWRARVAQVKSVPSGAFVGYGRTYRATHDCQIAVLPMGYHEGYDRRLSNLGHVLIRGVRAPIRGRVCMNMTMVDVTHVPEVQAGDVATLLGRDGDEQITAEQLAEWMGTINYEVVARIHPALPRRT